MAYRVPDSCEICNNKDKPAKVLPCFHILCDDCTEGLQVRDLRVQEIACPVDRCGKHFKKDVWRPDAYPVSYHRQLAHLKESVEKGRVTCDPCFQNQVDKVKATSICKECGFVCEKCVRIHTRNPNYSDHLTITLAELSQSRNDAPYHHELKRKRALSFDPELKPPHGTEHSPQTFRSRILSECQNQNYTEDLERKRIILQVTEEEAKKKTDEIKKKLPDISASREKLGHAAAEVKATTDRVKAQQKTLATLIDNKCDRLKRKISQVQSDLHTSLNYLTNTKLHLLQSQQERLEGMVKELQRLVDFTECKLETSTATELLANSKFFEDRISEASQEISKAQTEPVELANMAMKDSVTTEIQRICNKQLRIYTQDANPKNCTVDGLSSLKVESFQEACLMVNVVDKHNKPCPSSQNVTAKVICSHNEHSFFAQVNEIRPGKVQVFFKPEFSGDHQIHIDINDESIKGSPFSVKVQMPSTQSSETVQETEIISGIEAPRAVALTDDDSLLVCEMQANKPVIIKLDRHHRHVAEYGCKELFKLNEPAGISLDTSGNMYVVDGLQLGDTCRLVKFDEKGEMVKVVENKKLVNECSMRNTVKFRCIQVNKHNSLVYVGDYGNHCIQIFSCDLEHLQSIELWHGGTFKATETNKLLSKPSGIVFDEEENMYVTDYANHCILVFNKNLEFKAHYITRDHATEGGPDSISIDEAGLLYVTVSQSHCVLVFRKNGKFVKRFGRKGHGPGEFNLPTGIAVNRIGSMVYVCDFFNKRIQLFY